MKLGMTDQGELMGIFSNLVSNKKLMTKYNLGLKIFPNLEIQPLLEEYIDQQQQVILNAMEQAYHSMCQ